LQRNNIQFGDFASVQIVRGSTLPYLGKNYQIEIIKNANNGDDKIELHDKFIVVKSLKKKNQNGKDKKINFFYENWL